MIGGHAMKVKVFQRDYNEYREIVMKTVKDGRAQGVDLESCVR